MTDKEFKKGISVLTETFGQDIFPVSRISIIWDAVKSLDAKWWLDEVNKAVLSSNSRHNFLDAISAEKRRRANERHADELKAWDEAKHRVMTDRGFKEALGAFKANSLLEAIENYKKGGQ